MKKLLFLGLFIIAQGCGLGDKWPLLSSETELLISDLKLFVTIEEYKRDGTAQVNVSLRIPSLGNIPIKFDQGESFKVTVVNHQGETATTPLIYDSSVFFWHGDTLLSDFYVATVDLPEIGSNYTITYTDADGIETVVSLSSQGGPDIITPEDESTYSVHDDSPIKVTWTPGGFDQLYLSYLFALSSEHRIKLEDTGSYSIERNSAASLERDWFSSVRIRLHNYTTYAEATGFGSADIVIETRDEINVRMNLNR